MELNDKIRGAIVGFAFGDSLGIGTAYMTRQEVASYYPDGLQTYSQMIRDAHRSQWRRGEWTNDTEVLLRLFENVLEEGELDIVSQASAFKRWLDETDVDVSPVMRAICYTPGWELDPIGITHRRWHELGITDATNESVGRALVTGIICGDRELLGRTRDLTLITNDDTRCVATAMILAKMFNSLLYRHKPAEYLELADISRSVDPRTSIFLKKAYEGDIDSLTIDDEDTSCWSRKAMAASLWGLWHGKGAGDTIYRVVALGGDADTNASLAGAMAGVRFGYRALPDEKEKMVGLDKLLDLADRLTDFVRQKRKLPIVELKTD